MPTQEPYSREMVDEKLQRILDAVHEVKDIAIETRDQARTTNGRVTKIESTYLVEDDLEIMKDWMSSSKTIVSLIGAIIIAVVLPVFGYFAYEETQLNIQVQSHLATQIK